MLRIKRIGISLIVIAFFLNPLFLGILLSEDGSIDHEKTKNFVIIFEIFLIILGTILFKNPTFLKKVKYFCKTKRVEIFLLIFSIVISTILGVIIFDITIYHQTNASRWHEFDSNLGWRNPINTSFRAWDNKKVSLNALGFRGEKINPDKSNFILYGDSVTFGFGVNDNETIAAYLQEYYPSVQVLNAGVIGYGLDQSWLNMKHSLNKLDPEIVILVIYGGNDLEDTKKDYSNKRSKPLFSVKDGKLIKEKASLSKNSCMNLMGKSYVMTSLPYLLINTVCNNKRLGKDASKELIKTLLESIKKEVEANDAKLVIVLTPSIYDFEKETPDFSFFKSILREEDISYIDIKHGFSDFDSIDNLFIDLHHFSPEGNFLVANEIRNHLNVASSSD